MNEKAFTIVEVLAVVVLLGVLATISIPTIQKYIAENKNSFNKQLEGQLLLAGKEYFAENKNLLPKISYLDKNQDGESKNYVLAAELLSKNYIKNDFVDADNNDCSDSYVIVAKNTRVKDYDWHACLICGKDENKKVLTTNDSYCSLDANWDDKEKPSCDGEINVISGDDNNKKIYNNENIKLFISPTDNTTSENNKNYSSIVIHNETTDAIYVKDISNETEENIKTIDIAPYLKTDGNYSISIMDKGINKSNSCISDFIIDNTNPKCTISGNPTDWVTNATLTVSGEDENGLYDFPYSWTSKISGFGIIEKEVTSNGTYTAYVKDIAGNVGSCDVTVSKIDTSKPTVTIKNDKTSWTKDDVTVNVSASDGTTGSGIDRIEYSTDNKTWYTLVSKEIGSKIYDTTTDITFYAKAIDKVGIESDVKTTTVKVDKTPPNAPKVTGITFANTREKKHNCSNVGGGQNSVSCKVCMYVVTGDGTWDFNAKRSYSDTGSGINSSKTQNIWTHNATNGDQFPTWEDLSDFDWAISGTPAHTKITYGERNVDKVGNVGYSTTIYYHIYRDSGQKSNYDSCVNGL